MWKRTQEQHLDLIALHHLVPLKLVLNLLVAGLALLLLSAHSATHLDDVEALAALLLRFSLDDCGRG